MTELAVYRVAQEALTNVARHSGSDRADLTLADGTGQLTLTVRDYGHGLGDRTRLDGNGLRGMRERAAAVGGNLRIGRPARGPGSEVTPRRSRWWPAHDAAEVEDPARRRPRARATRPAPHTR